MAEPPKPWMTREQFVAAMQRAGLTLATRQIDELHRASEHIGNLVNRVHAFETDPLTSAPAIMFKRPLAP